MKYFYKENSKQPKNKPNNKKCRQIKHILL